VYRTPPPPPDPLLVVPGQGLRGVLVGRSTAADVLRTFGEDCQVHRHASGDIYKINYDSDEHDAYLPRRPAQEARPEAFDFEYGLLDAIRVGPYQKALYTTGGVRYGSSRAEVRAVFGPDATVLDEGAFDTVRYPVHGIGLSISKAEPFGVTGFVVFRAAR